MDTTVIPEQPDQNSSSPCNANRNTILGELQSVVDKRFASLDFGDRVSRDASKLIGFGTYGDVYEGILNPTQTKVAVKVVRYGDKSALPALERVLREIYVWSKLKHKNVIELLGITTAFDHTISIVSPLMSRGNAFDYVQNQDVDPRPLILGIANGLHYLHTYEQGHIIHGDIKGSNVLVSDDGRALLTDFGFSHLAAASFSLAIEQRQGGSLCWMAPEYLKADDFTMTTAGDVWAFGMTVLELFTRKHPFDHLKGIGVVLNHILYNLEWERPSSDASCSRLTDEWWNVCLSCWNRDPSQRTPISSVVKNIRTLQTLSKVITNSVPFLTPSYVHHKLNPGLVDNATARRPEYPNLGVLDQLAERASRYNILNGRVFRDGLVYPNNFCNIHLGTLQVAAGRTVVYSSRDNENAIKVGIKTPRVGLRGDTEAAKNIFREAHIQSKLRHKHILPLLGITTDFDLTASIVTPWMEKGNAHDYVQDRAIDPRPLIWEIGLGLHYLHNHSLGPIIHGDLKGYNVVISDDGRALLHDFSLSLSRNYSFSASVSGYLGGTLNWAAPELLDSGHASTESDVWAFGMIALELFTRRVPFHDYPSFTARFNRILRGRPERPIDETTCSRMTDQWWNTCLSCWNRDLSLRPAMSDIVKKIGRMMHSNLVILNDATMDPALALEELSKLASSYGFDLGARIERDKETSTPDGTVTAFRGKLRQGGVGGIMATETMVAVKAIRGHPSLKMEVVKHMVEGIFALTKLVHENILTFSGITTKLDGTVSLVSEWMTEGNAHEYVQNCDVDPRRLLLGVASGLQYLHGHILHPIFHGALKGSNILISPRGQALLTDFGLLDLVDSPFLVAFIDTINWTSPERLDDPKGSAAGDVWAFGMTALELFTRAPPFGSIRGLAELERRIARGPPDRPNDETTCRRLTDGWWKICMLCWSQDPSLRLSIDEVLVMVEDELLEALRRNRSKMRRMLMQYT